MKKTNKLFVVITTMLIIFVTIGTTNAMYGNGQGNGQGQGMNKGGNGQQINNQNHTPGDLISSVATGTLSEQEKQDLFYQYSEEMVARDIYTYFYSLYGIQTFQNISSSEQEHMDAVKVLLDRYNLDVPTTYGELQDEFTTLKAEGEKGLKEALEVGVKIEMLDINDIVDTIKTTENDDIKIVLTNIGGASYNHMRGFLKALQANSFETIIDYSDYLSQDEVNSKGSLKYKLAEVFEADGVVLPEQSSSSYIKENCKNEEEGMGSGQGKGKNANSSLQQKNQKFNQNKNLYKSQIEKKYGNTIKNANQNKLNALEGKLDKVIESVENNITMTQTIKDKYLSLYYALKEYLDELR